MQAADWRALLLTSRSSHDIHANIEMVNNRLPLNCSQRQYMSSAVFATDAIAAFERVEKSFS